jgi:arabinose-5-phosphate isomerase
MAQEIDYLGIAREVLLTEAFELQDSASKLDDCFIQAVQLILETTGKLIVIGVGKSGIVGTKIAATLASTGTPSFFIHPTDAMHGDLGMVSAGDTILAISYSGESAELIDILPHIKRRAVKIIGLSADTSSSLGSMSDVHICIKVSREACPLGAAPTSSTTLTMAIGDALAVVLMKRRGFQKEDFALFHPGGSLGRRLFIKVKDIMRTSSLPIVSHETLLKDAIVTMSEGRLGNVLIENNGKLEAVLSDGDLRRALMKKDFSIENLAYDYATKNPKTINNQDMLAVDLLRSIEAAKIQLTIVLNSDNKIAGVIHLHDLVEAGIK